MKFKKNILATIILATSLPVLAHQAEVSLQQDGASWYANFDSRSIVWANANPNPILDNDPDVLTFTGMAPGTYSVSLIGLEWGASADPIQFTSITLNGVNADIYKKLFVVDTVNTNTPFKLSLEGVLKEAGAYYTGTFQVSAVPEPETYAMFLAGLGLMGGIARRRKQK